MGGWLEGRRRNVCRKIMFTREEWERVEARWDAWRWTDLHGESARFSDWARRKLTDGKITQLVVMTDPAAIRSELAAIGNNVNQIARTANTYHTVSEARIREVLAAQRRIEDLFQTMSDDYHKRLDETEEER
ncbi:mobilization protein [Bifidobacterium margollesii]|uniref:Mobilization protein n=1 Tax=Bifidobacterium margollesii TaxID=2020964 RepID=A0A2N5J6Q4_9BIFI|nr:MobC family plasmid mobilization relaxosome protein [Bifidobacterium margollesii]PLS29889.1 mobilization protein [Bifidobacterium margollesii]PLS29899.1 mobilization protein [Bifidobacterium margollesii]